MKHIIILFSILAFVSCTTPPLQQVGNVAPVYDGETQDFGVMPTNEIRTGDFEAPTPLRISGAETVFTNELRDSISSSKPPILVDVLGGSQSVSLPNAFWLRGAGLGTSFGDETEQHLAHKLNELTRGDKSTPIAFFCLSKTCWLSHNTALRAVKLGYSKVLWYRGGRNAWIAAGLPMQPVRQTPF